MGFGALASESTQVTDQMFLRAAQTLAAQTSAEDLALGRCYPALSRIREVRTARPRLRLPYPLPLPIQYSIQYMLRTHSALPSGVRSDRGGRR